MGGFGLVVTSAYLELSIHSVDDDDDDDDALKDETGVVDERTLWGFKPAGT